MDHHHSHPSNVSWITNHPHFFEPSIGGTPGDHDQHRIRSTIDRVFSADPSRLLLWFDFSGGHGWIGGSISRVCGKLEFTTTAGYLA